VAFLVSDRAASIHGSEYVIKKAVEHTLRGDKVLLDVAEA